MISATHPTPQLPLRPAPTAALAAESEHVSDGYADADRAAFAAQQIAAGAFGADPDAALMAWTDEVQRASLGGA